MDKEEKNNLYTTLREWVEDSLYIADNKELSDDDDKNIAYSMRRGVAALMNLQLEYEGEVYDCKSTKEYAEEYDKFFSGVFGCYLCDLDKTEREALLSYLKNETEVKTKVRKILHCDVDEDDVENIFD